MISTKDATSFQTFLFLLFLGLLAYFNAIFRPFVHDDLAPFRKFQKLSALRSGNLLNYSQIARDVAVSVDSARRYLEYLKISYQVILLPPFYKNITSTVVRTPKIYWLDVGLLRQLTGW